MLAIKLWNYIRGYVIIRIEGLGLERLLNLALSNDIYLWDVKRLNKFQVEVTVSKNGLMEFQNLIKKVGCQEVIIRQYGLPYWIIKLKARKAFVIGLLTCIIMIIVMVSFVWRIEIIGAEQTSVDEIIAYLDVNNINTGTLKASINDDKVEQILLEKYNYFSFINVQKKGIKLVIDIKEEPVQPEKIDKSYPANIVARKRGVIQKIIARNGESIIKVGELVRENQLLISGVIEGGDGEFILVRADGEVFARTRYEATVEDSIVKKVERETGEVFTQMGIRIKNRGIKFIKDIPFENSREYIEEQNIIKWGSIDFPIKLVTYEYREMVIEEIRQEEEALKVSNQLKAIEQINSQLFDDAEIVAKDVVHFVEGNIIKTTVVIETIEEISKIQILNN